MYARPRRLSNSSNFSSASSVTGSTIVSRESFQSFDSQSRMRSSSWSSETSFESAMSSFHGQPPSPHSRPRSYAWQRPAPLKTHRKKAGPNELFSQLPGEVLELILEELKKLHLEKGSKSCATCWMRDTCSVGMSCRKWLKFARTALYEDIQIVGPDSAHQRKKYKAVSATRLVLLRRTLRGNPTLAAIPHSLKVPAVPVAGVSMEEYQDLVATVVMSCPNLERLTGPHPNYGHTFSRLFHALSTRQRLKDMTWILDASPIQRQHRVGSSSGSQAGMAAAPTNNVMIPRDLHPHQSDSFLDHHANWNYLSSLTIHCLPGATLSPASLLPTALSRLPSLQTLYLSHLPVNSFDDSSLLYLPPLKKLSIANCAGVSSSGLSSLATHSPAQSMQTLTLIHANLDSLPALARIFSNLPNLTTFSLVQSFAPILPDDTFIWLMPYLASGSLQKLHWDILDDTASGVASPADNILARSIAANGFPSLRALRTPNDPEGTFQSLCRPRERVDLPGDRYKGGQLHHASTTPGRPHTSAGHAHSNSSVSGKSFGHSHRGSTATATSLSSPISTTFGQDEKIDLFTLRDASDLHWARLAAQDRLEAARRLPRFQVNVVDERGEPIEKYGIAGFMGNVESKITYHLLPDAGAVDERGGLVGIDDLLGDGGEELYQPQQRSGREGKASSKSKEKDPVKAREGCTGRWNTYAGQVLDKKDKERWWHTERGRWMKVTLS
ncbi:hypothetical protein NKR23_g8828 [Pleurostoma richardsiae]|uniref:F-box domain-containing protein n=1 Tax=Pleurostoma richardsiae TaxID=41990 RepID=A0AA38RH51_9PEZI|nr:hypothetical protein NKR23_g8828 [Pleurostoma richardsiae]